MPIHADTVIKPGRYTLLRQQHEHGFVLISVVLMTIVLVHIVTTSMITIQLELMASQHYVQAIRQRTKTTAATNHLSTSVGVQKANHHG